MRNVNLGLSEHARRGSVDLLNRMLSNENILLIKTKKAHWDVVGPQFLTLHELWDAQYDRIGQISDDMAERIRTLGGAPIATAAGFVKQATLEEHPGELPTATQAVTILLDDHEAMARELRKATRVLAVELEDAGTADYFTKVLQDHEKMAWVLRSFLQGEALAADRDARPAPVPNLA